MNHTFTRTFEILADRAGTDGIDCSLSSSEPVRMSHAPEGEILSHAPGAIDFSRCPLPLLVSHDRSQLPIGQITGISSDGSKLRGKIVFGSSARAAEIAADVQGGIVRSLSIGYRVTEQKVQADGSILVTRWQPFECSLVSVPADSSVGIGRSLEDQITSYADPDGLLDDLKRQATDQNWKFERFQRKADELLNDAACTRTEIDAMCARADIPAEKKAELIKPGVSLESARKAVMDIILERSAATNPGARTTTQTDELRAHNEKQEKKTMQNSNSPIGLSAQEVRDYSLAKAFRACATGDWRDAGFERAASDACGKLAGKNSGNFFVPFEVLGQRDLNTGAFAEGGALVPTVYGEFIDNLRIQTQVLNLGATILTGLSGNVAMPRQTGSTSAHWIVEGAEMIHSQPRFDQVLLSPKTLAARTNITRRLLMQSSLSIEAVVRNDLLKTIALELDRAAINGTGVNPEPLGILNVSGISSVAGGATGAAPTYLHCVSLVAALENLNAAEGNLGFLTTGKVKAKLMVTEKSSGSGVFVWESGAQGYGSICGYRAASSGNVPCNLTKSSATGLSAIIFGAWQNLIVGMWGPGLEIETNPFQNFDTGEVGLRALLDVDIAVRNPVAFAAMTDAIA